jgi:predicted transcriptional regulator
MQMRKIDDAVMLEMIEEGKSQKEVTKHFGVSPAAVCKRMKKYPPIPESVQRLTEKQQRFALEVDSGKTKTQAALSAYEVGSMENAKSMGKELMKQPDILTAVAEIMQTEGLNRTYRVRRLKQHVDNRDPGVSLKALDQSWKLDGAYIDNHNVNLMVRDVRTVVSFDCEIVALDREMAQLYRSSYEETGDKQDLKLAKAYEAIVEESDADIVDAEIIEEDEPLFLIFFISEGPI